MTQNIGNRGYDPARLVAYVIRLLRKAGLAPVVDTDPTGAINAARCLLVAVGVKPLDPPR